jgi:hypothetical protein
VSLLNVFNHILKWNMIILLIFCQFINDFLLFRFLLHNLDIFNLMLHFDSLLNYKTRNVFNIFLEINFEQND